MRGVRNTQQNILERVVRSEGCWEFLGAPNKGGYTQVNLDGKKRYVHDLMFEWFVGPLDKGKEIHHTCENRWCVNPQHLEGLTPREHLLRTNSDVGRALRTGKCKRGHLFDEQNTHIYNGKRHCRKCRADHARKARRTRYED